MSRLRGLLPGLLLIVVLPLTLVLIVVALAATTLHQNEMRNLVAAHNQQAAHEAAAGLDDRVSHQLAALRSIAEATAIGLSPIDELRSSDHLLSDFDGGVIVFDAHGTELATLPQPAPAPLLAALRTAATKTPGIQLTSTGDVLAIARSTDGTIMAAGLFSPQALRLPTLAELTDQAALADCIGEVTAMFNRARRPVILAGDGEESLEEWRPSSSELRA